MKAFLCLFFLILQSCNTMIIDDYYLNKQLSYDDHKVTFSISEDDLNPVRLKTYYWYKAQKIHASVGDYSGELLHGDFTKYYMSNQLAEKGKFRLGLKDGVWKSWYENGALKTVQSWRRGIRDGVEVVYSDKGEITKQGRYVKNVKQGEWIDYAAGDTIHYHNGEIKKPVVKKAEDTTKTSLFKRIFRKKKEL